MSGNEANIQSCRLVPVGRMVAALVGAGLLAACGGGGGGGGGGEIAAPDALPSPSPSPSTAMSANPAPRSFAFAQYSGKRLTLDLSALAPGMNGAYYVVKIDDGQGQTIYLGSAERLQVVQIPVSVPNTLKTVWVEIFTDEPQAGTVRREIAL